MLGSHTESEWSFLRQSLSESLGRAPLCLRFLSRLTEKILALTKRSLKCHLLEI